MDLEGVGCKVVGGIPVALDGDRRQAVGNTIMNFGFPMGWEMSRPSKKLRVHTFQEAL